MPMTRALVRVAGPMGRPSRVPQWQRQSAGESRFARMEAVGVVARHYRIRRSPDPPGSRSPPSRPPLCSSFVRRKQMQTVQANGTTALEFTHKSVILSRVSSSPHHFMPCISRSHANEDAIAPHH